MLFRSHLADPTTGTDIAGQVRKVFAEEIGKLFSTGRADVSERSTSDGGAQPPDIRGEVQAALGELKRAEDAERRAGLAEERLKAVEKAVEKTPRESRWVEKFMGWHEDGDD